MLLDIAACATAGVSQGAPLPLSLAGDLASELCSRSCAEAPAGKVTRECCRIEHTTSSSASKPLPMTCGPDSTVKRHHSVSAAHEQAVSERTGRQAMYAGRAGRRRGNDLESGMASLQVQALLPSSRAGGHSPASCSCTFQGSFLITCQKC